MWRKETGGREGRQAGDELTAIHDNTLGRRLSFNFAVTVRQNVSHDAILSCSEEARKDFATINKSPLTTR
jgi:hypothetical protein